MDLELITNEVFNRIMEVMKKNEVISDDVSCKKFLQSGGNPIALSGFETIELEPLMNEQDILECEFLVIGILSIDDLVASATGMAINEKTRAIRQFLLNGKDVYIIEEGFEHRSYKRISNSVYYKIFNEYEKKLGQYSVQIMSERELSTTLTMTKKNTDSDINQQGNKPEIINRVSNENAIQYSTEKKLITYELAKELIKETNVTLRTGTLITPYAKDVFKEENVTITFV